MRGRDWRIRRLRAAVVQHLFRLLDLPEPYVAWFRQNGYPRGRLGELLATLYEIKANGLEPLLAGLRDPSDPRYSDRDPRTFREGDR